MAETKRQLSISEAAEKLGPSYYMHGDGAFGKVGCARSRSAERRPMFGDDAGVPGLAIIVTLRVVLSRSHPFDGSRVAPTPEDCFHP